MSSLFERISDEGKRQKALKLVNEKGWSHELAAVAVLNDESDEAIDAISAGLERVRTLATKTPRAEEIERLNRQLAELQGPDNLMSRIAVKRRIAELLNEK